MVQNLYIAVNKVYYSQVVVSYQSQRNGMANIELVRKFSANPRQPFQQCWDEGQPDSYFLDWEMCELRSFQQFRRSRTRHSWKSHTDLLKRYSETDGTPKFDLVQGIVLRKLIEKQYKPNPDCPHVLAETLFRVFESEEEEEEILITRSSTLQRKLQLNAECAKEALKTMSDHTASLELATQPGVAKTKEQGMAFLAKMIGGTEAGAPSADAGTNMSVGAAPRPPKASSATVTPSSSAQTMLKSAHDLALMRAAQHSKQGENEQAAQNLVALDAAARARATAEATPSAGVEAGGEPPGKRTRVTVDSADSPISIARALAERCLRESNICNELAFRLRTAKQCLPFCDQLDAAETQLRDWYSQLQSMISSKVNTHQEYAVLKEQITESRRGILQTINIARGGMVGAAKEIDTEVQPKAAKPKAKKRAVAVPNASGAAEPKAASA